MKSASGQIERLLWSAADLAVVLGVDRSTVWAWDSSGKLGPMPVKVGAKFTRWRRREIETWIAEGCPGRGKWVQEHPATQMAGKPAVAHVRPMQETLSSAT